MKKVFLYVLLATSLHGTAQPGKTSDKKDTMLLNNDTIQKKLQEITGSQGTINLTIDSDRIQREMDRNMEGILRLQKENNAKQKKAAITRIAIGVVFLAVFIVGMMRRRKKV